MLELHFPLEYDEGDSEFDLEYEDSSEEVDIEHSEVYAYVSSDHNELANRDLPDQHPIESITGLSDRLNRLSFVHKQSTAESVWTIEHLLNKYPSVTVVDSANTVVLGDVTYIDSNSLTIRFSGAFSGKAYLN